MSTLYSTVYRTEHGIMINGKCEDYIKEYASDGAEKVNLIFTSPPFPLVRTKQYGNMNGQDYLEWMKGLSISFRDILAEDGSIVIELGNAWEPHIPVQSTLPLEALLTFKKAGEYYLCQEFVHFNPAKLPAPIEWVNKQRIRVKDAFTRLWWLSTTPKPKANNINVLEEYSKQMKKLLLSKKYNAGKRPSEYNIGSYSFCKDNGGAIPANVLIASNTTSKDGYLRYCKEHSLSIHPARMPKELPAFFIKMLTDENDLILDPFAGSNITGYIAESLNRRWIGIEYDESYAVSSVGRFDEKDILMRK